MASTVLRFACPTELQIIDKRVYRLIMPENELRIPFNNERKVTLYFEYIEKLKEISRDCNIPFEKSDRIFYQLDKNLNSEIPIGY
jgi:thermostable 8-oxoguanine DNA glycosylase